MEYDDAELSDLYWQLDHETNIECTDIDGKMMTIIHQQFGNLTVLAKIERFVKDIARTKQVAFDMRDSVSRSNIVLLPTLERYFCFMASMLNVFDEQYVYSPRVDVFFHACKQIGILPGIYPFSRNATEVDPETGMRYGEVFNVLIATIRQLVSRSKFKRKLKNHEHSVRRRIAKVLVWEQRLFGSKSRYVIMPLTLTYKLEYRDEVTPELVQEHLRHFFNNRRGNSLLSGVEEYVWRMEEADYVGVHVHLLVAYDGTVNGDFIRSKQLCDYLETTVMDGMGSVSAGNLYKGSKWQGVYDRCGGKINSYDTDLREQLRAALRYMAKASQLLKRKSNNKTKTFGMSQPPEHSGKGRKRKTCTEVERLAA